MSKMSNLHLELTEQANEMGFMSIEDAEQHGWRVNYEKAKLEPPVVQPTLEKLAELEKAHLEWEADKRLNIRYLSDLQKFLSDNEYFEWATVVENAIEFIKDGEK